jgi:predicted choloylglycine hydrolase
MKNKPILLTFLILICSSTLSYGKVVLENKTIIPKQPNTYTEVHHLILQGSNQQIGEALGKIGQKWLGAKLIPFSFPLYASAKRQYIRTHYPILFERMKGVAKAYNLPFSSNYDFSGLIYDVPSFACSAIYFPPNSTTNKHAIYVRNFDFYITTIDDVLGFKSQPGENKLFSHDYVMELYPNKGYASIVVGSLDLLNAPFGGMNSQGLIIAGFADDYLPSHAQTALGGTTSTLSAFQMVRLVLDTCKTIKEAKAAFLHNKLYFFLDGLHYQITDRYGHSTIVDIDPTTHQIHFTDNNKKPQVITNHPVYRFPITNSFPKVSAEKTYDTFNRYQTLVNFLKTQPKKLSPKNTFKALSLVYAHTKDSSEGTKFKIPCRTLWSVQYDQTTLTMRLKFYLKDGGVDPQTGDPSLVFSKIFTFSLANKI